MRYGAAAVAQTPLGDLIRMFGRAGTFARAIGVSEALVSRWIRDRERPPSHFNAKIMAGAAAAGLDDRKVRKLLDWTCPTCGGRIR